MKFLHRSPLVCLIVIAGGTSAARMAGASEGIEDYHYRGAGKLDPFKPISIATPTMQSLSQLQDFDLKDLHLVGTLLGNEMSALIMTPKGEGVIARVGDKIGKSGGRIVIISHNNIVVREPSTDKSAILGGSHKRQKFNDIVMTLFKKKNELGLGSKQLSSSAPSSSSFPPPSFSSPPPAAPPPGSFSTIPAPQEFPRMNLDQNAGLPPGVNQNPNPLAQPPPGMNVPQTMPMNPNPGQP